MKRRRQAFDGADWLFEIKHDGFRVLTIVDGGAKRLLTRSSHDFSRRHAHITERPNQLPPGRFVLDDELVVLADDGLSNFAKVAYRRTGSHYYAFHILMLGNDDLRGLPLSARKRILETLVSEREPVRYTDYVVGIGREFFDAVKQAGLEGMVAERRTSKYSGTLTDDWLKVKCMRTDDFIAGELVNSILQLCLACPHPNPVKTSPPNERINLRLATGRFFGFTQFESVAVLD